MKKLILRLTYYYFMSLFAMTMIANYSRFYRLLKNGHLREAHHLRQILARRLMKRCKFSLQIIQDGYVPHQETCIICSNHASYLDIPVLCAALDSYFGFLGKVELTDHPLIKMFFRTLDIAVNREDNAKSVIAFKRSFQALQQGRSLVIFPEGGIFNSPAIVNPLKAGAFLLAIKLNVPILVVGLPDDYKRMDVERKTVKTGKIRVILHELIKPEGFTADELAQKVQVILQNDISKYKDNEN